MTDTQMFTLAVAFIVPISLLLYSNSRITDAKETLRAEMKGMTSEIAAGFGRVSIDIQAMRAELKSDLQALKTDLQMHVMEHHR